MIEGLVGLAAMLLLAFVRVPIALAMAIVGVVGYAYMRDWNWNIAFASVQTNVYETGRNYTLSVVPLFILMGNFVARAGIAHELFRAAHTFIGHLRGGLAMATIIACAGFGSICGSSIATAATMAKVAYPSMKRFDYSDRLAAGAIAAGGTLGIMIPPSTLMVIYGVFTETNIGKMFAAGLLPGLLGAVLLCGAVQWTCWRDPAAGPRGERASWRERFFALRGIWPVAAMFVFVIGGIYGGLFTATEAAGCGAAGAFVIGLVRGRLSRGDIRRSLLEATRTTAAVFTVLIGAILFSYFLTVTQTPQKVTTFLTELGLGRYGVLTLIMLLYLVLGCLMDALAMIILTVPIVFPVIKELGFDPIWFGVIVVVTVELGLIHPPVGMNIFVIKSVVEDVKISTIFYGVLPFIITDIIRLIILIAFPMIALWLPSKM